MNSDRCYHIPTSHGQSVCTCLDRRMWLELLVELQARRIAELETERQRHQPQEIFLSERGQDAPGPPTCTGYPPAMSRPVTLHITNEVG